MTLTSAQLSALHGRSVLVKSTRDKRFPATAVRGSIEVREAARGESDARAVVSLLISFPDMFNEGAHEHRIQLSDGEMEQLLASEREGTYEFTIDRDLE